jgi:hypothetical protein
LEKALDGRMMLITREGKTQALRDAMKALADHWNTSLKTATGGNLADAQPRIVENFYPAGEHDLTIVKMRMQMQAPLTPPPGSDPGEVHYAEVVAAGYFITLKALSAAEGKAETGSPVAIVAVFIFENSATTETILDSMIKSIHARK